MYHNPLLDNGQVQAPTFDVDAMLFEVSNRMARAQLARQISNSSATFKQRASRILKPNSVGNSPQNLQRRRTVNSHTTSRRSELYHQNLQPQQRPESLNGHQAWSATNVRRAVEPRPVSWHPSSLALSRSAPRTSTYEASSRHSIGGHRVEYQTAAPNGLPTPMTQPDLSSDTPVDPFFSLDQSAIPCQQSVMTSQPYVSTCWSNETAYQACMPFNIQTNLPYTMGQLSADLPSTLSATSYSTQTWAESLQSFPAYTAPPTPDFLPIQDPCQGGDSTGRVKTASQPTLNKSRSKELVGMGLYDAPDRSSFSSLTSGPTSHAGHESMGKGLKLEETWQPPEDDENEDEGDDEEDPQNEDTECSVEVPRGTEIDLGLPIWQDNTYLDGVGKNIGVQGMGVGYNDLSNQSFFFDGEGDYLDSDGAGPQVILKDYMWA